MTYISTRDIPASGQEDSDTKPTTVINNPLKLDEIDISERYLAVMSGTYEDASAYISAWSEYELDEIACIGMTRKHGLHEQLNTIITRLNEMEKLLAAIARNTQAITCTKTAIMEE